MGIKETDRRVGPRIRGRLVATALALVMSTAAAAAADSTPARDATVTAAINAGAGRLGRKVAPPQVLSEADVAIYAKVAELQQRGQWPLADKEMAKLKDDVLKGHVLAQRYLHPWYKARYDELKAWMNEYADHPQAADIHKVAKQRMAKGDSGLKAPSRQRVIGRVSVGGDEAASWEMPSLEGGSHLNAKDRAKLRGLKQRFRQLVKGGQYGAAVDMLHGAELRRLAEKTDLDELSTILAAHHFSDGHDPQALAFAVPAAERSGESLPQAHWIAGLAQWRSGKAAESRRHFEAVANADGSPWMISAGAYWAARANLVAKRPEVVNHWLEIAAANPRTFYGLLARRALGQSISFAWEPTPFTDVDSDIVLRVPSGRRALALLQLNKRQEAEEELRRLAAEATPALARSMLSLASIADMPELALVLGGAVANRDGRFHDSAAYPMPNWKPANGWTVDRALVFAFARQESGFDPRARSSAGAAGLMQLMPATAAHLTGSRVSPDRLLDPSYNLALGQTYIKHLLASPQIDGNLLKLAAAYNGGPGQLERWLERFRHHDDPLLFIESIPSRQTRTFVEKVMANLWVYRARLGQPMASLDAVVAGDWPTYDELDKRAPKAIKASAKK